MYMSMYEYVSVTVAVAAAAVGCLAQMPHTFSTHNLTQLGSRWFPNLTLVLQQIFKATSPRVQLRRIQKIRCRYGIYLPTSAPGSLARKEMPSTSAAICHRFQIFQGGQIPWKDDSGRLNEMYEIQ